MVPFWGCYHIHHLFSPLCQCRGIWASALGKLGLQLDGWLRQNLKSLCSVSLSSSSDHRGCSASLQYCCEGQIKKGSENGMTIKYYTNSGFNIVLTTD